MSKYSIDTEWDKVVDLQDTGSMSYFVGEKHIETLPTNMSAWCYKDGSAYLMVGEITWKYSRD